MDHDALPLYVLGALPDDERATFASHLDGCARCRRELGGYGPVLGHLAGAVAVTPDGALRTQVLSRAAQVGQHAPGRPAGGDDATVVPLSRRRRASAWTRQRLAVAAAVLALAFVAVAATGVTLYRDNAQLRRQITAEQTAPVGAVLSAPDLRLVDVPTDLDGSLRVAVSDGRDAGVVLADDLPAPPDGRTYQLWLLDTGADAPRSVGLAGAGSGVVGSLPRAADARLFEVSVEPAGGSDAPTGPVVAKVALD